MTTLLRPSAIFFTLCLFSALDASAQFSAAITEINPDHSTLVDSHGVKVPNGASGGLVNHIGAAGDGKTFYAASEWGGLFKSIDRGKTWSHLPGHVPQLMWDVKVDPTDPNRVYATSLYDGRVNSVAGINMSTDGGVTWQRVAIPAANFCEPVGRDATLRFKEPSAYAISIDPLDPKHVAIGTDCGLAISNDAGSTWRNVDPTPGDAGATDIWGVVIHHGLIDVCGEEGHLRSKKDGAEWTAPMSGSLPTGQCAIAASPDESHVLFAVAGETLYESDDGGVTWPQVFTDRDAAPCQNAACNRVPLVKTNKRSGAQFDLWFGDLNMWKESCTTPGSPAPGGTPRCSVNGWVNVTAGAHQDMADVAFGLGSADACPALLSSDGGVFLNTKTTSPDCHAPAWVQPDLTPHALWLMGFGGAHQNTVANEDLYLAAEDNGVFAIDMPGTTSRWKNQIEADAFDISADSTRVLYSNCCFSGISSLFMSGPGVAGGASASTQIAVTGNLPRFLYGDVVARIGPKAYAVVTNTQVFQTPDVTATALTTIVSRVPPCCPATVQVALDGTTPVLYVQSGVGDSSSADELSRFRGTGSGTWQKVKPPGPGGFPIFAVDPKNPNRLLAAHITSASSDPNMILSTNGGRTWTTLAGLNTLMTGGGVFEYRTRRGLSHSGSAFGQTGYIQPTLVAIDPSDGNIMVAGGADSGVFISIDGGTTWKLVTDPLTPGTSGKPHIPRPRFAYFDHDPSIGLPTGQRRVDVYIGSQGRGAWRIRLDIP